MVLSMLRKVCCIDAFSPCRAGGAGMGRAIFFLIFILCELIPTDTSLASFRWSFLSKVHLHSRGRLQVLDIAIFLAFSIFCISTLFRGAMRNCKGRRGQCQFSVGNMMSSRPKS